MSARRETATVNATARVIQNLAEQNHVTYQVTDSDRLAHHITRLAGDVVESAQCRQNQGLEDRPADGTRVLHDRP